MRVTANGLAIEVEDLGPRDAPPLLLVMGLGMQLTGWPDEFVALLLARGFRVIRFDNRDAGLSQGFDAAGVPSIPLAALRHFMRLPVRSLTEQRPGRQVVDFGQNLVGYVEIKLRAPRGTRGKISQVGGHRPALYQARDTSGWKRRRGLI